MKFQAALSTTASCLALAAACEASLVIPRDASLNTEAAIALAALQHRALPNAPNGYTPEAGECPPNRPTIRSASSLSPNETAWLELRRNSTIDSMRDFLGRVNITDFDAETYITNNAQNASALPNIGIAVSGGGYRAMLNGGGAFQAFDIREENSTAPGHLGGLLQSATYWAGLSGGSWLTGSIYVNNFTTITSLLNNDVSSAWHLGNSIIEGPATGGIQLLDTSQYYYELYDSVEGKSDAGFDTSITDYWGRALSFQLINATDGGPGYTWSSIALLENFSNGSIPMPILVSDARAPGEVLVPQNTTVYEFNPWELGTFDPTTYGFVPLEYLGSNFSGGVLPDSEQCVRGFDNAGFVMGTSSSLFNQIMLEINSTSIPGVFKDALNKVLGDVGQGNDDIAEYYPNPFYGYHNSTSLTYNSTSLTLVDGGEDLQNIPLHPLIQPARQVDVIFAVDSSADTENNWPNGTSLVATYERSLNTSGIENGSAFPAIPDQNTFVNLGLNTRPTFFGCNTSNMTGPSPLIVYIPNSPYVYLSNVSTFDLSYNDSERNAIVENGYAVATMANGTTDSQWPTCVGCAILSRSLERTGTTVPEVCTQCFSRYCWDGTVNSTTPAPYEPNVSLTAAKMASAGERRSLPGGFMLLSLVAAAAPFIV
ncbi:Lysophospholipase 1 [Hypocenomyce scalaris]|nr:Lysophospholipase 1 [Hypocenomyce scalaris]